MTKNKKADFEERVFGDANERFVGDVFDDEKMKEYTKLRNICLEITRIDHSVKHNYIPFSNRSMNALVSLEFPSVFLCGNAKVIRRLSAAFAIADDVWTSTLTGGLCITFGIRDMWTEFHYLEKK